MFRKIIVALFSMCVLIPNVYAAEAKPIAYMLNQDNGRIELYATKAPSEAARLYVQCKNALVAKTWGTNTEDSYGCWTAHDDVVNIFWVTGNGVGRTYYTKSFTMTKYGNKLMGGR